MPEPQTVWIQVETTQNLSYRSKHRDEDVWETVPYSESNRRNIFD